TNYLCMWDDLARLGRPSGRTLQNATTRQLRALDRQLGTEVLISEYRGHWDEIERTHLPRLAEAFGRAGEPAGELRSSERYRAEEFLPASLEATRRGYGGAAEERPLLAFKTCETPYVEDYLRVFPDLRCVHIVRHPETNYASAKRSWSYTKRYPFYWAGHDQLQTFLDARWLPHARVLVRLAEERPDRHLLV